MSSSDLCSIAVDQPIHACCALVEGGDGFVELTSAGGAEASSEPCGWLRSIVSGVNSHGTTSDTGMQQER